MLHEHVLSYWAIGDTGIFAENGKKLGSFVFIMVQKHITGKSLRYYCVSSTSQCGRVVKSSSLCPALTSPCLFQFFILNNSGAPLIRT